MRTMSRIPLAAVLLFALASAPDALAWFGRRHRPARADRNNDGVVSPAEVHGPHPHSRVNTRWEAHADTDHNGVIDTAESKKYWIGWQGAVNTATERRYDADANGLLTWNEARLLLRDRARAVRIEGQAVVDTDIEKEFDDNGDGLIDAVEAERVREAIED